jgi:hypothetical protein
MLKFLSLDSNEFLSKSRRALFDITPKIGFLRIKESNRKKMQVEKGVASSSTMMDPWSRFLYTMKAPRGRKKL